MSAKKDALDFIVRARDAWAGGDIGHALELLDAATGRLVESGYTKEDMPTTFELIERIRGKLLEIAAA